MGYGIVIYGFPIILLAFEWGLRTMLMVDSKGFTGPTLAAAGLSFLVPLLKPKVKSLEEYEGYVFMSSAENKLMPFLWMFFLIFLFAWSASCFISLKYPALKFWFLDAHLAVGIGVYLISLIFIVIKEKV